MRKFKTAQPLVITKALRKKVAQVRPLTAPEPPQASTSTTFEEIMDRAFPEHLHGSISGCCDSMEDGHGASIS